MDFFHVDYEEIKSYLTDCLKFIFLTPTYIANNSSIKQIKLDRNASPTNIYLPILKYSESFPNATSETNIRVLSTQASAVDPMAFIRYKGSFTGAVYNMMFDNNELKSSTTRFNSINRDIQLLEEPDFIVSNSSKIYTVARMRVSYKSLAPVN